VWRYGPAPRPRCPCGAHQHHGHAARNGYSFGAGYGTDTGARGTISWLNPRVNERGHRLRVQIQASQTTQNINARYDIPFGDPVLEKFSLQFLDQTQQIASNVYTRKSPPIPASRSAAAISIRARSPLRPASR